MYANKGLQFFQIEFTEGSFLTFGKQNCLCDNSFQQHHSYKQIEYIQRWSCLLCTGCGTNRKIEGYEDTWWWMTICRGLYLINRPLDPMMEKRENHHLDTTFQNFYTYSLMQKLKGAQVNIQLYSSGRILIDWFYDYLTCTGSLHLSYSSHLRADKESWILVCSTYSCLHWPCKMWTKNAVNYVVNFFTGWIGIVTT